MDFSLLKLTSLILEHECMNESATEALKMLGKSLSLIHMSKDFKTFIFAVKTGLIQPSVSVVLTANKGSFLTVLWNTYARFDDQYSLEIQRSSGTVIGGINKSLLWRVTGIDAMNSKITSGEVDWHQLRLLQYDMRVITVGVAAMAKLLGRMLLSFPNYHLKNLYVATMPASFMFNYLMVVVSSPLEVAVPDVSKFLADPFTQYDMTNKSLLSHFMLDDGRGAWIQNYFTFWLADGTKALCSRFYQSIYNQQSRDTNSVHSSSTSSSNSTLNKMLFQDTAVRVVELREHHLGVHGLIAVVELVHHRKWNDMCRYVVLDAYLLCKAISYAGQLPAIEHTRIPILDFDDWKHRLSNMNHVNTVMLGKHITKRGPTPAPDLSNSPFWGCPVQNTEYWKSLQQAVNSDRMERVQVSNGIVGSVVAQSMKSPKNLFKPASLPSPVPVVTRKVTKSTITLPSIANVLPSAMLINVTSLHTNVTVHSSSGESVDPTLTSLGGVPSFGTGTTSGIWTQGAIPTDYRVAFPPLLSSQSKGLIGLSDPINRLHVSSTAAVALTEGNETVKKKRKRPSLTADATATASRSKVKTKRTATAVGVSSVAEVKKDQDEAPVTPLPSIFLSLFPPPSVTGANKPTEEALVTLTTKMTEPLITLPCRTMPMSPPAASTSLSTIPPSNVSISKQKETKSRSAVNEINTNLTSIAGQMSQQAQSNSVKHLKSRSKSVKQYQGISSMK